MSRNREQIDDSALKTLIPSLLSQWYILLIFMVAGLLIALVLIKVAPVKYTAKAVVDFSGLNQQDKLSSLAGEVEGNSLALIPFLDFNQDNSLIAKFVGSKFLQNTVLQREVEQKFNEFSMCEYTFNPYTLENLFSKFGLLKIKKPTAEQIAEQKIACVRSMISISPFKYQKNATTANSIEVTSNNPFFSAYLANKLVKDFFSYELDQSKQFFENSLLYLSETLSDATKKQIESKKAVDSFILNNPSMINEMFLGPSNIPSRMISSVPVELVQNIANFQKKKSEIKKTISSLRSFKASKAYNQNFLEWVNFNDYLSKNFIKNIRVLFDENPISISEMEVLIDKEAELLNLMLQDFMQASKVETSEASQKMSVIDRFNELSTKKNIQKIYAESLERIIQQKGLEYGSMSDYKNQMLSSAIPPLNPSTPNIKIITILCIMFSFILFILWVFIRQMRGQYVFSLNQIEAIGVKTGILVSGKRELKGYLQDNNYTQNGFNIDLVSNLLKKGKIGCVIDVSADKTRSLDLSSLVAVKLANLFLKNGKKVSCILGNASSKLKDAIAENELNVNSLSKSQQNQDNFSLTVDTQNLISDNKIIPLKDEFNKFDHVLVSADQTNEDIILFNLIANCDFHVFLGKRGFFKTEDLLKYIPSSEILSEKCAGFILIK